MVDLGSHALLASIFGWKIAALYVAFGLAIAVAGGSVIEKLRMEEYVEEYARDGKSVGAPGETLRFKDRMGFAWEQGVSTVKKAIPYILVGVGIGTIIHNWIP